ncbi:HNH endonuclease family protein [Mycolicibacillus koreensis]|nr:HNH endonuclease family protein [Mycolicibacillus koreensis]BBY54235.1 hypothetical protein MKOR_14860 [Mycolicibacillus koreensis]
MDRHTVKKWLKRLAVGMAVTVGFLLVVGVIVDHGDTSNEVKTGGYRIPDDPAEGIRTSGVLIEPDPMLEILDSIEVKGRAPKTGYRRSNFGRPWTDRVDVEFGHNGCSTRDDILRRDLHDVTLDNKGCRVMSGVLHDPYTDRDIAVDRGEGTAILIQVDHVVPLKDAWQKGAQNWDEAKRTQFANDPLNLLAVGHQVNKAKRDADIATWLPPNRGFWCEYVSRVVEIKARYGVWMTQAEHDKATDILNDCAVSGN